MKQTKLCPHCGSVLITKYFLESSKLGGVNYSYRLYCGCGYSDPNLYRRIIKRRKTNLFNKFPRRKKVDKS